VLSACDTGAGDIYPGEGVIGMSWAMLAAGCSQVIVSQWMADSRATSELMIEFHRQLKHRRSAADALRRAELKLLKSARYSQPFYWRRSLPWAASAEAALAYIMK